MNSKLLSYLAPAMGVFIFVALTFGAKEIGSSHGPVALPEEPFDSMVILVAKIERLEQEKANLMATILDRTASEGSTKAVKKQIRQIEAKVSAVKADMRNHFFLANGTPDYYKIVVTETKRREALGKKGKELEIYLDGGIKTIGYGNHIKYLTNKQKAIIKSQGGKITEAQARDFMNYIFDDIDKVIKRDQKKGILPKNLSAAQKWAIKSLAFNWGYGNIQTSALWPHLKAGRRSQVVRTIWITKTQCQSDNHKTSRHMEAALWNGDNKTAIQFAQQAYEHLYNRGDFNHYK